MGVYQVVTRWDGVTGTPYYTVLNFWDATSSQGNATAANTKVQNFLAACTTRMSNGITWSTETTVNEFALSGTLSAFWTTAGGAGAGAATGDRLPPFTNGLIRLETGTVLGGRKFRGRIFMPAPVEADNLLGGGPQGAYLTTMNNAMASLLAAGSPALTVWSRRYAVQSTVTSGACQGRWAILRSRRD